MKKLSILFLILFAAVFAQAAQVVRGPYIEDPTQTTMADGCGYTVVVGIRPRSAL
mgnify:CR=1 FL=1